MPNSEHINSDKISKERSENEKEREREREQKWSVVIKLRATLRCGPRTTTMNIEEHLIYRNEFIFIYFLAPEPAKPRAAYRVHRRHHLRILRADIVRCHSIALTASRFSCVCARLVALKLQQPLSSREHIGLGGHAHARERFTRNSMAKIRIWADEETESRRHCECQVPHKKHFQMN